MRWVLRVVHWEDPEGWDGERGGRRDWDGEHVNPWMIHANVWQKPLQYCKVMSLQLIKINGKINKMNHKKIKKIFMTQIITIV